LLYRGQCIHKRKTRIMPATSDPEFGEFFDLSLEDVIQRDQISLDKSEDFDLGSLLAGLGLFFLVMDDDKNEKNDAIGQVKLEQDEFNDENEYAWSQIFAQPNSPVTLTCPIRSF
jgi:hypothetical protein